jgi:hypothetical protein
MGQIGTLGALGLAGVANSENLKAVVQRLEIEFFTDGFLHGFQIRPEEFNDGVAIQADQVIVVLIAMDSLVVGVLIAKALLANQAALHQQV